MLAGLPYVVWPIGSAFILASRKKEDPFLHYHAVQALLAGAVLGVVLLVLILGLFLTFRVMPGSAHYGPAVLGVGIMLGGGALLMGVLLFAIFLGWRATEGEMLRLPIIGDYAEEKMLDQTGMTRRQFEAMLESSMHPIVDEEIPFPEASDVPEQAQEPTVSRLDAMRQARKTQMIEPESHSPQVSTAAQGYRPPESPSPQVSTAAQGYRPPAPQQRQPTVAAHSPQQQVREVDLIGHYKETQVDVAHQSSKADVLRQWLSSVDE